jgi:hypothetical protein
MPRRRPKPGALPSKAGQHTAWKRFGLLNSCLGLKTGPGHSICRRRSAPDQKNIKTFLRKGDHPEAVRKVGVGHVTSRIWAESRRERRGPADGSKISRNTCRRAQHPKFAVTLRAEVFLTWGGVARSSRSCGYAPHSTPRRKAKSLPAQPVSTFAMSSNPSFRLIHV